MTNTFCPELHSYLCKSIRDTTVYKTVELADDCTATATGSDRSRVRTSRVVEALAASGQRQYQNGLRGREFRKAVRADVLQQTDCGSFMLLFTLIYYVLRLIIAYRKGM